MTGSKKEVHDAILKSQKGHIDRALTKNKYMVMPEYKPTEEVAGFLDDSLVYTFEGYYKYVIPTDKRANEKLDEYLGVEFEMDYLDTHGGYVYDIASFFIEDTMTSVPLDDFVVFVDMGKLEWKWEWDEDTNISLQDYISEKTLDELAELIKNDEREPN